MSASCARIERSPSSSPSTATRRPAIHVSPPIFASRVRMTIWPAAVSAPFTLRSKVSSSAAAKTSSPVCHSTARPVAASEAPCAKAGARPAPISAMRVRTAILMPRMSRLLPSVPPGRTIAREKGGRQGWNVSASPAPNGLPLVCFCRQAAKGPFDPPRGEGGWLAFYPIKMTPDRFDHIIGARKHIIVPETKHRVAIAVQECRPPTVVHQSLRLVVLPSIGFDDELSFEARKIDYVCTNAMLPPKVTAKSVATQAAPEPLLRL